MNVQSVQLGYVRAVSALAAATMAAMVVLMSLQVFYRYVLSDAIIWAEEVCRYLLVWMTFLFAGAAFQRGEMVTMELLIGMLPGWAKRLFLVPAYLVTVAFACSMVWYGWEFAEGNRNQIMPAAQFISQTLTGRQAEVSIFWVYIAVPAGFALLALHMLASAVRMLVADPQLVQKDHAK